MVREEIALGKEFILYITQMIDWYFLIFLRNFFLTCLEGDILRAYKSEDSNFFLILLNIPDSENHFQYV